MIAVTIAIAIGIALAAAAATGVLWKHPTPLDRVLCELPPLRWPRRKTPRKETPCSPAASTASTTAAKATPHRAPKAATTANSANSAAFAVPTGRHHIRADRVTIGGELPDGRWVHGGTGPMPALAWDAATPFAPAPRPGAAERLVRP